MEKKYLVIDVGGTSTKYAVMDEDCNFLEKGKFPSVQEPLEGFVDSIVSLYRKYEGKVEGIAMSMPGVLDSRTGFMHTGGKIECIHDINMAELLEKECKVPVTIENDAKSAALAEVWRGALKDCENAVVMVCGTGIGGAVIQNREVVRGKHNMAGEFSYMLMNTQDPFRMENLLGFSGGGPAFIEIAAAKMGIPVKELNGEMIFDRAEAGDEKALEAIHEYAKILAVQATNYQFILDPERIAVGGGISVRPLFLEILKEEIAALNHLYDQWDLPAPEVVACQYFNDSNLIGALYVHLKARERKEQENVSR